LNHSITSSAVASNVSGRCRVDRDARIKRRSTTKKIQTRHNRRHHSVGGNRYRGPFGRHKNSSGARVFDPLARASVEPSKRQGVTLRQLEEENSKLRKIVADLSLDKGISGRICLRSAKDAKDAESFERAHTRSRRSTTGRHERWRAGTTSIASDAAAAFAERTK
jgi:hypothetical protein